MNQPPQMLKEITSCDDLATNVKQKFATTKEVYFKDN